MMIDVFDVALECQLMCVLRLDELMFNLHGALRLHQLATQYLGVFRGFSALASKPFFLVGGAFT